MDDLPQDGREAIPELKTLAFLKERRNVILIGNSGTGKTHMAIAVGIRACEENYRVIFRSAAALVNEMIEARKDNRLSIYIKQFKKIDLLIIDELGYVTFDLAAAELLFQLLAARYETMSTIITSNLGFSDWVQFQPADTARRRADAGADAAGSGAASRRTGRCRAAGRGRA